MLVKTDQITTITHNQNSYLYIPNKQLNTPNWEYAE